MLRSARVVLVLAAAAGLSAGMVPGGALAATAGGSVRGGSPVHTSDGARTRQDWDRFAKQRVRNASPPKVPAHASKSGGVSAGRTLHLQFVLQPRDAAGLRSFATAVSTPGNPRYRKFLAKGEFAGRFGALPSAIADVRSYLAAEGLHPGPTSDGLFVPVTVPVATATRLLGTTFASYRLGNGTSVFANTAAPSVPAPLVSELQTITGLDDVQQAKPVGLIRTPARAVPTRAAHAPSAQVAQPQTSGPQPCATIQGNHWTADELASAYQLPSLYSQGLTGSGQTVGMIELEPFTPSDINAYQSCYGTNVPITIKSLNGGAQGPQVGEAALDIEVVATAAPGAKIIVYSAPNGYQYYAYQAMATDDTASVLSSSWAACEPLVGSAFAQAEATLFQQMVAQGQDLFAASGDTGAEGCERMNGSTALAVSDPSSQPDVTVVGGTKLTSVATPPAESVWNETTDNAGAGGGGISTLWSKPTYQTGPGVLSSYSSSAPCASVAGTSTVCREVPDVSASADPEAPYIVYWNGSWSGIGGTSAAAPMWAGILSVINQSCPTGFINPALYQMPTDGGANALNDITSGNNDYGNLHGGSYPATAGFDMASGLGTPVASGLLSQLCSSVTLHPGGQLTTGQSLTSANGAYVLTLQADGNLVEYATSNHAALWATGPNPTATRATMQGDGNFVVYTAGGAPLWASNTAGNPGASLTLSASGQLQVQSGVGVALWQAGALLSGKTLGSGQRMSGLFDNDELVMQADGNLVEYAEPGNTKVWSSDTSSAGAHLAMQADGNLVVYSSGGAALWATNTAGNPGAVLTLPGSGQLTLSSASGGLLWGPGLLAPGNRLAAGQSLRSANNAYQLTMQADGNLVQRQTSTGAVVWASGAHTNGAYAGMQNDGNLVVYDTGGSALWASDTAGNTGAYLTLAATGQLTVTTPSGWLLWGPGYLAPGSVLNPNAIRLSANRAYALVMQPDGNLVDVATATNTVSWAAGTNPNGSYATMQTDGNFVVYAANGTPVWASNTANHPGAHVTVTNGGQVLVSSSDGSTLWASPTPAPTVTTLAGGPGPGPQSGVSTAVQPSSVASHGSDLYVADDNANAVRKVTPNGTQTVVAGDGGWGTSPNGAPATSAHVTRPQAVALDAAGDLFIASNDGIQMRAASSCAATCPYGISMTTAGDLYTLSTETGIRQITLDTAQDLVLAYSGGHVVQLLARSSCSSACAFGLPATTAGQVYAVAGSGSSGATGDGGPASSATLSAPAGVAFDSAGDLLVADSTNNSVRLVAATSCAASCAFGLPATTAGNIYRIAGDGTYGSAGDGGAATAAQLAHPAGLTLDPMGDLIVADTGDQSTSDSTIRMIAAGACASACPFGLASTSVGGIYTIVGNGTLGYSGEGKKATANGLSDPQGTALDSLGNLVVADKDDHRLLLVAASTCASSCPDGLAATQAGDVYTIAGNGTWGQSPDGGPATSAELPEPDGVAVDARGDVFVDVYSDSVVRMIAGTTCSSACPFGLSTTAGSIYTVAGTGSLSGGTADGAVATTTALFNEGQVAVDPAGDLLIPDTYNGRVRLVAAASCTSTCPFAHTPMTAGHMYVVAGNGGFDYTGDGGPAVSATLNAPGGVASDAAGNLLIADSGNNVIRVVAAASCPSACAYGIPSTTIGNIYTVAGNGTSGTSGDGGIATAAQLANPINVAADAQGDLLVSEPNHVELLAASTCAAACRFGRTTTAGHLYALLSNVVVYGLTVDPHGDVLFTQHAVISAPSDVMIIAATSCPSACPFGLSSTTAGHTYTVVGDGSPGFSGDGAPAQSAEVAGPKAVAVDAFDNVFVADTFNNRIRVARSSSTPSSTKPARAIA